jgi:hypothetical protein
LGELGADFVSLGFNAGENSAQAPLPVVQLPKLRPEERDFGRQEIEISDAMRTDPVLRRRCHFAFVFLCRLSSESSGTSPQAPTFRLKPCERTANLDE